MAKDQAQTANARNATDGLRNNVAEAKVRAQKAEAKIKDLKHMILKLQTAGTQREREIHGRETRIRKAAHVIKSYEEEVFTRDSEILKRDGKIR